MAEQQKYWFQYFPNNFMWSQGMMIAIEMARWGGSAMSEVDRVGQRLKGKIGDNEAWGVEWEREAQRIEKMGDDAAGHDIQQFAEVRRHQAVLNLWPRPSK